MGITLLGTGSGRAKQPPMVGYGHTYFGGRITLILDTLKVPPHGLGSRRTPLIVQGLPASSKLLAARTMPIAA